MTHHKAESSLKTYTGYTSEKQRKRMSHTLSSNLGADEPSEPVDKTPTTSVQVVAAAPSSTNSKQLISVSEDWPDIGDLSDLGDFSNSQNVQMNSMNCQVVTKVPTYNFSNCQVTINNILPN